MKYFGFVWHVRSRDTSVEPVAHQDNTLSETASTSEAENKLNVPVLLAAGPANPVTGLSYTADDIRSVGQLHPSRLKAKDSSELVCDVEDQHEERADLNFPLEQFPICLVCSRNRIGSTTVLNRQVFWTLRHLRVSSKECATCLMIANAMGHLLHTEMEDGLVCGRVEHFATDCRSLHEARRLWLFTMSVDQARSPFTQSVRPTSYLEPEQPTTKHTLGCIQRFGREGSRLFSGRYVDPKRTDFGMISRWLSTCETSHSAKCGREVVSNMEAPALRVVDVLKGCVVKAPVQCRYVALSYVWGTFQQLQLNSSTLDDISTEGILFKNERERGRFASAFAEGAVVPNTIHDAITLCQKLGERFLWVDSLCILQDSDTDKHSQIAHMDAVYREAVLTIVAAAGTDCNHGLPGVRGRQPISFVADTGEMALISTDRDVIQTMLNSKWNKRAWTLQEKILSQRLLVFTPQLVFFYCHTALWREDIVLEDTEAEIYLNERELLDSQILDRSAASHGPIKAFTESYAPLVTTFVCRELSREEDALSAFSGVCRSLEPALGIFNWGLPSRLFGISLLWRVSLPSRDGADLDDHKYASSYVRSTPMLSRSVQRTSGAHYDGGHLFLRPEDAVVVQQQLPPLAPLHFDPETGLSEATAHRTWNIRSGFPSWSWAGWKHLDGTQILFDQPLDIRSLVSLFRVTFLRIIVPERTSSKKPTIRGPLANLDLFIRCGLDLYRIREELQDHLKPPINILPFNLIPLPRYYHARIANNTGEPETAPINPQTLIAFWTSTSQANIRARADSRLTISTSSGLRMAELDSTRRLQMRLGGLLEFIVVAYTLEGELVLMLVQWSKDGIAYRAPILDLVFRISQVDWIATNPYKKRIVLG